MTALIGPTLAIVLRVAPARDAFAPFADPIIFLFIGSFMLAEAMFLHNLDRRVAFGVLSSRAVSGSPLRILFVFGGVAAVMSMWISNTATTAMMFPIGLSIVAHLTKGRESEPGSRDFATAMMLIAAFGSSIGGVATPIGTPPNLIGIGMLSRIAHVEIGGGGAVAPMGLGRVLLREAEGAIALEPETLDLGAGVVPGLGRGAVAVQHARDLVNIQGHGALRTKLRDAVVLYIVDPEVVEQAHAAGVGARLNTDVGGKSDSIQGPPVRMQTVVRALSNGDFTYDGPMYAGLTGSMGRSAWLEQDGVHVLQDHRPAPAVHVRRLLAHGVRLTVNTDGPELYHTNVFKEQSFLMKIGALTRNEIAQCDRWAFEASFIQSSG